MSEIRPVGVFHCICSEKFIFYLHVFLPKRSKINLTTTKNNKSLVYFRRVLLLIKPKLGIRNEKLQGIGTKSDLPEARCAD